MLNDKLVQHKEERGLLSAGASLIVEWHVVTHEYRTMVKIRLKLGVNHI
jgi:hypothetical protein